MGKTYRQGEVLTSRGGRRPGLKWGYNRGRVLGNIGGLAAMASQCVDHPGEQFLSDTPDGKMRVWVDRNARDTPEALRRYAHPFYRASQRLWACGYNLFNLGGI